MKNKKDYLSIIAIVLLCALIVVGTVKFSFNLAEKIEDKKELKELQKEKLILEIQLLKKDII